MIVISVGSALTLVTGALLAVGLLAVQYLAGGAAPPRLELPGPVGIKQGAPPEPPRHSQDQPEEAPQVLLPHEDRSPSLGFREGPFDEVKLAQPDWNTPLESDAFPGETLPGDYRTAQPDLGPRYR